MLTPNKADIEEKSLLPITSSGVCVYIVILVNSRCPVVNHHALSTPPIAKLVPNPMLAMRTS